MVSVSEAAAKKFKELASKTANPDGQMFRLSFGGFG
jgi:hypothetical protein